MANTIGAAETHISQLFFTPDRVFKLLKPVDTSFLSLVEREQRLAATEAEFRLNRRIAPDVYLGLADLVEDGELADRLIVMRRLPADRQLDQLVAHPDFLRLVAEAARAIAAFHSGQASLTGEEAKPATVEHLRRNWSDNLNDLAPLAGSLIPGDDHQLVAELVDRYLAGREAMFAERIDHGWVRDGHGDLRAEHVFCLDDGPRIIDCLAFRDDYRIGDVLNDIAFLAMDLDRLAGPKASSTFMRAYVEFTAERHPSSLAHHYVAYRAHVRAKVSAVRAGQGEAGAAAELAAYHRLALDHLAIGQVRLVLVGGGPGAGKSTVAEGLASRLGAIWLRSDEARLTAPGVSGSDQAGAEPVGIEAAADRPDQGRYHPARSDQVYRQLVGEAERLLARGESVVLDASWSTGERRDWARQAARRTSAQLTELHCELPLAVAQDRIRRRSASGRDPSEATPAVAAHQAERFEAWTEADPIDTSGAIPDVLDSALHRVLGAAGEEVGHPTEIAWFFAYAAVLARRPRIGRDRPLPGRSPAG